MPLIRARHEVFGVCEVPDTGYYLDNGWTPVDDGTPTEAERGALFNPAEHSVEEVAAYLAEADEAEQDRVRALELDGKARKSIVGE